MRADELRALQAPLKEEYRRAPASALITLSGVLKEVTVGFQRIRLRFDLDTDASEEQLDTLLRLTERDCVVAQTLRVCPTVQASMERAPRA